MPHFNVNIGGMAISAHTWIPVERSRNPLRPLSGRQTRPHNPVLGWARTLLMKRWAVTLEGIKVFWTQLPRSEFLAGLFRYIHIPYGLIRPVLKQVYELHIKACDLLFYQIVQWFGNNNPQLNLTFYWEFQQFSSNSLRLSSLRNQ